MARLISPRQSAPRAVRAGGHTRRKQLSERGKGLPTWLHAQQQQQPAKRARTRLNNTGPFAHACRLDPRAPPWNSCSSPPCAASVEDHNAFREARKTARSSEIPATATTEHPGLPLTGALASTTRTRTQRRFHACHKHGRPLEQARIGIVYPSCRKSGRMAKRAKFKHPKRY